MVNIIIALALLYSGMELFAINAYNGQFGSFDAAQIRYDIQFPVEQEGFDLLEEDFSTFMDDALLEKNGTKFKALEKAQHFIIESMEADFVEALKLAIIKYGTLKKVINSFEIDYKVRNAAEYIQKHKNSNFVSNFLSQLEKVQIDEEDGYTTLLHLAARHGRDQIVKFLIESGVNLNAFDSNGATALHDAAINGRKDIVRILLDAGKIVRNPNLNINIQDTIYGNTPLHFAVQFNHPSIVEMLLKVKANDKIKNFDGMLAIDYIGFDEDIYTNHAQIEVMKSMFAKKNK